MSDEALKRYGPYAKVANNLANDARREAKDHSSIDVTVYMQEVVYNGYYRCEEADHLISSLRQELAKSQAAHAVTEREACSRAEDCERLRQELKEAQKDAERYRWLRGCREISFRRDFLATDTRMQASIPLEQSLDIAVDYWLNKAAEAEQKHDARVAALAAEQRGS